MSHPLFTTDELVNVVRSMERQAVASDYKLAENARTIADLRAALAAANGLALTADFVATRYPNNIGVDALKRAIASFNKVHKP